jgi:hypothetical protein
LLLTLGDSFTTKRFPEDKPWPEHLAEMWNMKLMNLSEEGTSNDFMFRNLVWALETEKIDCVVVALSNWDRMEFGKIDYGSDFVGLGYPVLAVKPKILTEDPNNLKPKNELHKKVLKEFSVPYFIDRTSSYILAIQNLCKAKQINLIFIQPISPFTKQVLDWAYIDEFVSSDDDNVRMMRSLANHVDYIDNYSLLKHVDKTQLMFNTSGLMFFKKENSDDQMWSWFNLRKNVTNPLNLGFHDYELYNTDIPKGFYKDVYDQHPNQAGHKRIAETINNYYKEIYE